MQETATLVTFSLPTTPEAPETVQVCPAGWLEMLTAYGLPLGSAVGKVNGPAPEMPSVSAPLWSVRPLPVSPLTVPRRCTSARRRRTGSRGCSTMLPPHVLPRSSAGLVRAAALAAGVDACAAAAPRIASAATTSPPRHSPSARSRPPSSSRGVWTLDRQEVARQDQDRSPGVDRVGRPAGAGRQPPQRPGRPRADDRRVLAPADLSGQGTHLPAAGPWRPGPRARGAPRGARAGRSGPDARERRGARRRSQRARRRARHRPVSRGRSHSEPSLGALKTGAARLALQAGVPVRIIPVGLTYAEKGRFRSAAGSSSAPRSTCLRRAPSPSAFAA